MPAASVHTSNRAMGASIALVLWALPLAAASAQSGTPATPSAAPAPARAIAIPRPDELEPGVSTTPQAPTPLPAAPLPATAGAAGPGADAAAVPDAGAAAAPPAARAPGVPGAKVPAAAPPAAGGTGAKQSAPRAGEPASKAGAHQGPDRLELEATEITGNRELPKVLYIVPWKRSDLGDLVGKPVNSLLDEVLQPLDRDVFQRENRYYEGLKPGSAAPKAGAAQSSGSNP